jgi:hypothetical protein
MMEDSTGLPMLLQGQLGKAPDTVGGMTMLNNNASAVLRRLARTFDDCVTEPHIRRYYAWLLQYGEDDEKGDFSSTPAARRPGRARPAEPADRADAAGVG